jgi:hypothetical protein
MSAFDFGTSGYGVLYAAGLTTSNFRSASYLGRNYIGAFGNATGSGQQFSLGDTASTYFVANPGERLAITQGIFANAGGPISAVSMMVYFMDSAGSSTGSATLQTVSGTQGYNTRIGGFCTVPANSVRGRIETYFLSNGSGTMDCGIIEPMVSQAAAAQTVLPAYTPGLNSQPGATAGGSGGLPAQKIGAAGTIGYPSPIKLASGQTVSINVQIPINPSGASVTIAASVQARIADSGGYSTLGSQSVGPVSPSDPDNNDFSAPLTNSTGSDQIYDLQVVVTKSGSGTMPYTGAFFKPG